MRSASAMVWMFGVCRLIEVWRCIVSACQECGGGAGQAQAGGGGDRGGQEDQQEDPGDRGVHRGAGLAAREGEDRAHEEENQKSDKQNLPSCVRGGHRGE